MKHLVFIGILALSSATAQSWDVNWAQKNDTEIRTKQEKAKQQQMEERPSSTAIGGARSGELEMEKDKETQRQYEEDKIRQMYEYDGLYRRGL